jgi:hypothetical protein
VASIVNALKIVLLKISFDNPIGKIIHPTLSIPDCRDFQIKVFIFSSSLGVDSAVFDR